MEDVLQGCGDACGSFCIAYHLLSLGGGAVAPSNDAPGPNMTLGAGNALRPLLGQLPAMFYGLGLFFLPGETESQATTNL